MLLSYSQGQIFVNDHFTISFRSCSLCPTEEVLEVLITSNEAKTLNYAIQAKSLECSNSPSIHRLVNQGVGSHKTEEIGQHLSGTGHNVAWVAGRQDGIRG